MKHILSKEESYALWARRLTMTSQLPQIREQALTLLKIEREEILENFKREKKSPVGKRSHAAEVRLVLSFDRFCGSRGYESLPLRAPLRGIARRLRARRVE
jgi:hypothetical protein